MSEFREVFVKAVCGRSRHAFHDTNILNTHQPVDEILGCRVTNHQYAGIVTSGGVKINGSYDIHVWYTHSAGQNTTVMTKTIDYSRAVSFDELGVDPDECHNAEANIRLTHGPICSEGSIVGTSSIRCTVDVGYLIEVIGDTRLCVKHYPGACDDYYKKDLLDAFDDDALDDELLDEFEDEADLVGEEI